MTTMTEIYKVAKSFADAFEAAKKGHGLRADIVSRANDALALELVVVPGPKLSHVLDIAEAVVHGDTLVDYLAEEQHLRAELNFECAVYNAGGTC